MKAKAVVDSYAHLLESGHHENVLVGERSRHRATALTVFDYENRMSDQSVRGQLPMGIEQFACCPIL